VAAPRIAVVGCGYWGKNLARNFHGIGHLSATCESQPAQRAAMASQYPEVKAYERLEQVLEDPSIDAAVLSTPAATHCALGLKLLAAGKDLFVEKPLALEWEDGLEMVDTARARGRILMVGHLLRYHPAFLKIEELLGSGALGKIEYIYSNRLSMGKIRKDENALWSFAPHDISLLLALTGQMPVQVSATGGAYLQPNVADVTVSHFSFSHGVRAHIFVSWLHPHKEQRLVIIGSKQMVVFEDTRPDNKLLLFDKRIESRNGVMEASKSEATAVPFDAQEPLRLECQHFVDCVRERRTPVTPGEEGVRVLQVLQACQRSLEMNGQPVQTDGASARPLARM
jgi:UDP-2-acetamido-3-amino-2,3-dideoxy-glucuronate N-acetyltransferase